MNTVDGFLSKKASEIFPGALVLVKRGKEHEEEWILRVPGEDDMGLGPTFAAARTALDSLISHERLSK